jgi:hypothetical protein
MVSPDGETQDDADGGHVQGTFERDRCVPSAYVDSGLARVIAGWLDLTESDKRKILAAVGG